MEIIAGGRGFGVSQTVSLRESESGLATRSPQVRGLGRWSTNSHECLDCEPFNVISEFNTLTAAIRFIIAVQRGRRAKTKAHDDEKRTTADKNRQKAQNKTNGRIPVTSESLTSVGVKFAVRR
jgi:hypothetical protein